MHGRKSAVKVNVMLRANIKKGKVECRSSVITIQLRDHGHRGFDSRRPVQIMGET